MQSSFTVQVIDMASYDPEDRLVNEVEKHTLCIFVISTYTDGMPPDSAAWFFQYITESSTDCRVPKHLLTGLQYTIFGLGNSCYGTEFNAVAKCLDRGLQKLSGKRIFQTGLGDEDGASSENGGLEEDFEVWVDSFLTLLSGNNTEYSVVPSEEKNFCRDNKSSTNNLRNYDADTKVASVYESSSEDEVGASTENSIADLEDLGAMAKEMIAKSVVQNDGSLALQRRKKTKIVQKTAKSEKEMVTPVIRKNLEKQGYKIIGSHSGVKICRWTKAMLRGRGGCYKHTFYGINSHQCMETTPSLACANKCVFCWRHHTNPVGTEWKWQLDDPNMIVKGAMENHYKMIKQFKGVPGVLPERFLEGMQIKHCALSLVGEPIMYPGINDMVDLLHSKEISTFLVTNAQFPEAIRSLKPVTQLYVSVDASDKESLKRIDRPLFRDYWQRFVDSLNALKDKGQRTVYRLTLVKSFNSDEVDGYAKLVELGSPSFIEVKGVTYCGTSKESTLTMQNVPWHQEVVDFVQTLCAKMPSYELASEHEHSNCVLLAHKKFKINNTWHTWIDYPKFHELISRYDASGGKQTFTDLDYIAQTPDWAVYGDSNRGFDPKETRFYRKKCKNLSGC